MYSCKTKIVNGNNISSIDLEYDDESYNSYLNYNEELYNMPISFTQNQLNEEIWKSLSTIPNEYKQYMSKRDLVLYNASQYYVSNLGRVSILDNNKLVLKTANNAGKGYKCVSICGISYGIHRLCVLVYVYNPEFKYKQYVNHLDRMRNHNVFSNFRWDTLLTNTGYKTEERKYYAPSNKGKKIDSIIICKDIDTNEKIEYKSFMEALKSLNCQQSQLSLSCMHNKIINTKDGRRFICSYKNGSNRKELYNWEPVVQLNVDGSIIKIHMTKDTIIPITKKIGRVIEACKNNKQNKTYTYGTKCFCWMFVRDYNELKVTDTFNEIILPECNIIMLTDSNCYIKMFTDFYQIVNDDALDLNKVLQYCNKNDDELIYAYNNKRCSVNCMGVHRKFFYRDNFYKLRNITSLDQLSPKEIYRYN